MKLSSTTRQFFSEVSHGGWVIIVLMFGIVAIEIGVDYKFGAAWGLISAAAGLGLWLLLRPWKLALLSQESRRQVFISGTLAFVMILVSAALSYWKI